LLLWFRYYRHGRQKLRMHGRKHGDFNIFASSESGKKTGLVELRAHLLPPQDRAIAGAPGL
jgi:hypothetical protein